MTPLRFSLYLFTMKTLGNEVRFAIWFIDLFTEGNIKFCRFGKNTFFEELISQILTKITKSASVSIFQNLSKLQTTISQQADRF